MRLFAQNTHRLVVSLTLSILFGAASGAEYDDSFIIPQVEMVVQTNDDVAIAMSPAKWGALIPKHESGSKYFRASRRNLEFESITEEEFLDLHRRAHRVSRLEWSPNGETNEDRNNYRVVTKPGPCSKYTDAPAKVEFIGFSVPINIECNSRIADAIRVGDDVWVLAYEQGGHGSYAAEGIIVLDTSGVEKARVDIGSFPPLAAIGDQQSSSVWIVTEDSTLLLSADYKVINKYWPVHQFNPRTKRPEVSVVSSSEEVLTDPLAILAYELGEDFYADFYDSIKDVPQIKDTNILYSHFMYGASYEPALPEELNTLIPSAKPTREWQKFVCMLDDPRAKHLCNLPLSEWPVAKSAPMGKDRI